MAVPQFWALPTPQALLTACIDDIVAGRSIITISDGAVTDFREALGPALGTCERTMDIIRDESGCAPGQIWSRRMPEQPWRAGVYWIDGIVPSRAPQWLELLRRLADRAAGFEPAARALLFLPLVGASNEPPWRHFHVARRDGRIRLQRRDLEVTAAYATLGSDPNETLGQCLLAAASVEIAALALPDQKALDLVTLIGRVPPSALSGPGVLLPEAKRSASPELFEFLQTRGDLLARALWRAQVSIFMPELDRRRLKLIANLPSAWRPPYSLCKQDGTERAVSRSEDLQIADVCFLTQNLLTDRNTCRDALQLRRMRNALCHDECLSPEQIGILLRAAP